MSTHELWQAVLGELELTLSKANFTTWFKNTSIASFEDDRVIVSVPSAFTKTWLEKRYNQTIRQLLQKNCTSTIKEITYRVDMRSQARPVGMQETFSTAAVNENGPVEIPAPTMVIAPPQEQNFAQFTHRMAAPVDNGNSNSSLNAKYTFETYIVGKGNELAHAAALAIAENPGTKYNPLFIYGDVGLGKTHLIHAVGNDMIRKNPAARVLYATCERFTSDFIHAVKSGRAKEFKDTYRLVDLLIIDDIQFISGKDGTQEEFFHTFNALHQANKQVILTSDRPPKQIPALEGRLSSRFECGMIADISSPDFETRIAILETKCKTLNCPVDNEVLRYIASIVQSNVRELEGALNKIIAYSQLKNTPPTTELTKSLLSSFGAAPSKKTVTTKHLLLTVSQYFDVNPADMLGKCREKRLAFPRQIIMYLMREEMSASYPTIGNEIGGRDHTTAMHAYDKIKTELENSPKLRQDIDLIKQRLYNT